MLLVDNQGAAVKLNTIQTHHGIKILSTQVVDSLVLAQMRLALNPKPQMVITQLRQISLQYKGEY